MIVATFYHLDKDKHQELMDEIERAEIPIVENISYHGKTVGTPPMVPLTKAASHFRIKEPTGGWRKALHAMGIGYPQYINGTNFADKPGTIYVSIDALAHIRQHLFLLNN